MPEWTDVWERLTLEEAKEFKRRGPDHHHKSRAVLANMCVAEGGKVLECGFGSGIMFELLHDKIDYTGFDVVARFVEACKEMFPEDADRFHLGDMKELPFEADSFKTVFCRSVIEHLPPHDVYRSIAEMVRVASKQVLIDFYRPPWNEETLYYRAESGCWANTYNSKEIRGYLLVAGGNAVAIHDNIGENKRHAIYRTWKF